MPIGEGQFDQDLQALVTAVNNYIAAVNAFIALPPVVDLTNEDTTVNTAAAAVTAAQAQIPGQPGGPSAPKTS